MLITKRSPEYLSSDCEKSITKVIEASINQITTIDDKFIINDTLWYAMSRKGKVTPCVVNSAAYISKSFQNNLSMNYGWEGETKIDNQNFDGYGEVPLQGTTYRLSEKNILAFLRDYLQVTGKPEYLLSKYFAIYFGMYIERSYFSINHLPAELHHYFIPEQQPNKHLRIGVEFETGNIGSSFRAINKLNSLFLKKHIDLGIFITSTDKSNCSARIWPTSNRNGSFTELEQRNYQDSVNLPLMEFGFSPDSFSSIASYLGEKGQLFTPIDTKKTIINKNQTYNVFLGFNGEELFKPSS